MDNERIINFAAGPAAMPLTVLEEIQKDLVNYKGAGLSVMEMSHRSKQYEEIFNTTKETLKEIMEIPDDYEILFLQGGASLQFSMIPMNLAKNNDLCYYAITGNFAKKAYEEAVKCSNAKIISSSENDKYSYVPSINKNDIDASAKYVHITINNTIYGTEYNELPDVANIPLVGDMSSIILGKYYDVKKFGLIYAGAQKNLGPAGVTLVIIKKNLINEELDKNMPTMLKYSTHAKNNSMYNTPPTFGIYVMGLTFKWVKSMGGVKELEKLNVEKSNLLYDYIDNSSFYMGKSRKESRSIMNVTFDLPNDELKDKFVNEAKANGMINLKGHRVLGGIRASIYNAITIDQVKKLVDFMYKFEKENK